MKSCLLLLNIPLSNCCGQAYNSAANMRENISGAQACIRESNKTAVYIYCMSHQLNLVVQECITDTVEGENALEILNKVSKFVTASPKRLRSFLRFNLACQKPKITLFNFKTTLSYLLGSKKGIPKRFSQQLQKAVALAVRHV